MAQKLTEFPSGGREGYSRYPWDEWLDGSAWELSGPVVVPPAENDTIQTPKLKVVGGEDFTVSTKSFRSAAAQAARLRNGGIKTAVRKIEKDGETAENVIIQFLPASDVAEHEGAEDLTETESETTVNA